MNKENLKKSIQKNRTAVNVILIFLSVFVLLIPSFIYDNVSNEDLVVSVLSNFSAALLVSVIVFFFFNWLGIDEEVLSEFEKAQENSIDHKDLDHITKLINRNYRKIKDLNIDDYECKIFLDKHSFFETYFHAIGNAKKNIYSVGGGFRDDCEENRLLMSKLYSAIEQCLQNKVKLFRYNFSYSSKTSSFWLRKLLSLKNAYQSNFKLYSNLDIDPAIKTSYHSMTVVDEGLENNYIFILLNSNRHESGKSFSVFDFHYGIVVKNNLQFAEEVKLQIKELYLLKEHVLSFMELERRINDSINNSRNRINHEIDEILNRNQKIDIKNDYVIDLMCKSKIYEETIVCNCLYTKLRENLSNKKYVWYWAYDLDINHDEFKKKYTSAHFIGKGKGRNYSITENIGTFEEDKHVRILDLKSTNNQANNGSLFWGILYAINQDDFIDLEGDKKKMGYNNVMQIKVKIDSSDELVVASTFNFEQKQNNINAPMSNSYRNYFIRGLHQNNFPVSFKNKLQFMFDRVPSSNSDI